VELVATVTTVVVVSGMVDIVVDVASELVVAIVLCAVVGIVDAVVLRAVVGAVTDVSASPNALECSLLQGSQECHKLSKKVQKSGNAMTSIDILPYSSTFFRPRYLAGIVVRWKPWKQVHLIVLLHMHAHI